MSRNKHILVDVDNVLFDFNTPFYEWIEGTKHLVPIGERGREYRFESLYGTTLEEMVRHVEEFSSGDIFAALPVMEGCQEAVGALREREYTFEAITACVDSPKVRSAREKGLRETYGITDIHYVGLGQSKFDLLSKYRPCFWVEDNLKNARDGSMAGHYTFLIDHAYNRETDQGVHRVKNWGEIEAALLEME